MSGEDGVELRSLERLARRRRACIAGRLVRARARHVVAGDGKDEDEDEDEASGGHRLGSRVLSSRAIGVEQGAAGACAALLVATVEEQRISGRAAVTAGETLAGS